MLEFGDRWRRIGGQPYFNCIFEGLPDVSNEAAPETVLSAVSDAVTRYDAANTIPLQLSKLWVPPSSIEASLENIREEMSAAGMALEPSCVAALSISAPSLEETIHRCIQENLKTRLENFRDTSLLPYDAEFEIDLHRVLINCRERPWRVEALLACTCSYQEDEFYLLLDGERQSFALRQPALMALSGSLNDLLYGEEFKHAAVYSGPAFAELLQLAAGDFCDLPHTLLNQIKWKMRLSGGLLCEDHLHISSCSAALDRAPGIFLVDTHPLGFFEVAMSLDWQGKAANEVRLIGARPLKPEWR